MQKQQSKEIATQTQNKTQTKLSHIQESQLNAAKQQRKQTKSLMNQNPQQNSKTSLLTESKTNKQIISQLGNQQKKKSVITCNCHNYLCCAPAFKDYFLLEQEIQQYAQIILKQEGGQMFYIQRRVLFEKIKQLDQQKQENLYKQNQLETFECMFKVYQDNWLASKKFYKEQPNNKKVKICKQKIKALRIQQDQIIQTLGSWGLVQFQKLIEIQRNHKNIDMIATIQSNQRFIKKQIQWEEMRFQKQQQKRLEQDQEYFKKQIQVLKQFMIEKERQYLLKIQQTMNRKNQQIIDQYAKKLKVSILQRSRQRTQAFEKQLKYIDAGAFFSCSGIYRDYAQQKSNITTQNLYGPAQTISNKLQKQYRPQQVKSHHLSKEDLYIKQKIRQMAKLY